LKRLSTAVKLDILILTIHPASSKDEEKCIFGKSQETSLAKKTQAKKNKQTNKLKTKKGVNATTIKKQRRQKQRLHFFSSAVQSLIQKSRTHSKGRGP